MLASRKTKPPTATGGENTAGALLMARVSRRTKRRIIRVFTLANSNRPPARRQQRTSDVLGCDRERRSRTKPAARGVEDQQHAAEPADCAQDAAQKTHANDESPDQSEGVDECRRV